jgi:hypothetical protein
MFDCWLAFIYRFDCWVACIYRFDCWVAFIYRFDCWLAFIYRFDCITFDKSFNQFEYNLFICETVTYRVAENFTWVDTLMANVTLMVGWWWLQRMDVHLNLAVVLNHHSFMLQETLWLTGVRVSIYQNNQIYILFFSEWFVCFVYVCKSFYLYFHVLIQSKDYKIVI